MKNFLLITVLALFVHGSALAAIKLEPEFICNGMMGTGELIKLQMSLQMSNGKVVKGINDFPKHYVKVTKNGMQVFENSSVLEFENQSVYTADNRMRLERSGNKWFLFLQTYADLEVTMYLNTLQMQCEKISSLN